MLEFLFVSSVGPGQGRESCGSRTVLRGRSSEVWTSEAGVYWVGVLSHGFAMMMSICVLVTETGWLFQALTRSMRWSTSRWL